MLLVNTRPDISCATSMASRTTFDVFKEDSSKCIKDLNKIVKHVKSIDLPQRFPILDIDTLKLVVYTDSYHSATTKTCLVSYLLIRFNWEMSTSILLQLQIEESDQVATRR
jgi:hypothetical protein